MRSLNQRDKKREWSLHVIHLQNQEKSLLKVLHPTFSSKKWKKISQIFKEKGYDRSQLQIRQRWTNFQDPSLLFTQWTEEELQTLYKNYNKFGSKWCFIKKAIPGRTENKIKNKFYGNIRIYLRFIVNYFNDSKEDTMWIHKINPSILNDVYKGNKEFSQFGNEMQIGISEMGYNIDKIRLLSRIQTKEEQYKSFYNKIIVLFRSGEERKQSSSQRNRTDHVRLSQINYGVREEEQEEQEEGYDKGGEFEKEEIDGGVLKNMNSEGAFSQAHVQINSNLMSKSDKLSSNFLLMNFPNVYPYFNCWFYRN